MKSKVLLLALASMLAGGAMAQDCTFFFPTTKGTKLVKKSYDGKGNLSGVMTYVVDEVESKQSGLEVEAGYVFVNNGGTVIDKGELEAFCQDGDAHHPHVFVAPGILRYLSRGIGYPYLRVSCVG